MTVHLSTKLQHLLYFLPTLRVSSSPSHCSAQCQKWFLIGSIHSPTASHPLTFEACQAKAWQLFFTKHETKWFYSENTTTTCTGWKWISNWKFLAIFFHVFALASEIQTCIAISLYTDWTVKQTQQSFQTWSGDSSFELQVEMVKKGYCLHAAIDSGNIATWYMYMYYVLWPPQYGSR